MLSIKTDELTGISNTIATTIRSRKRKTANDLIDTEDVSFHLPTVLINLQKNPSQGYSDCLTLWQGGK